MPKVEYIKIEPSYAACVAMCIAAIENGSPKGVAIAKQELAKYGQLLDELKAKADAGQLVEA